MLELPMAAARSHFVPAVGFDDTDRFPHLRRHVVKNNAKYDFPTWRSRRKHEAG
jgi:hypothetical protein